MKLPIIFQKGNKEDINKIFDVFTKAIDKMLLNGIYQWDEIYPTMDDITVDLNNGQLYVGMIEQDIAVVYVLSKECTEEYMDGKWTADNKNYIVLHRLCVHPKFQNNGIGKDTLKHIENEVSAMGIESIRLDVFSQNLYARKMYQTLGYKNVGEVHFRKGMFYLMEKIMENNNDI